MKLPSCLSCKLFSCTEIEANKRQQAGTSFPGVVFVGQTKVFIGTCVSDLELIATLGHPNEFKDSIVFLPL